MISVRRFGVGLPGAAAPGSFLRADMSDLVARLRDWQGIRMSPEKMAHFIAHAQEAADRIEQLEALLKEARGYVVGDHGWDYETGGWLADRVDAALEKK